MKIKLKKGQSVPRDNSFSGLSKKDWNSLNAGKEIELDKLPKMVKPFIEKEKSIKEK
jgi:hypothetical protein